MSKWHIEYSPKPIPDMRHDYDFWHDDFDGENGLGGTAESVEDAWRQIKEMNEETMTGEELGEMLLKSVIEMRGRTPNKALFRKMKKSDNPVTRSVIRGILISRFERGEHA